MLSIDVEDLPINKGSQWWLGGQSEARSGGDPLLSAVGGRDLRGVWEQGGACTRTPRAEGARSRQPTSDWSCKSPCEPTYVSGRS